MATAGGLPEDARDGYEQRAENAALRAVRAIINAVLRIIRGTTSTTPVAGAPPIVALDPTADTAIVVPLWTAAVTNTIAPIVADTWTAAAAATAADFAAAGLTPNVLGPDRGAAYLSEATNRLVGIGDVLWQQIAQSLAQGMDVGEGIPELAARVQAIVPVTEGRATRIARTEVVSSANAGSFAQAQALGDPTMTKIWQATNDARTRETHREADGQTQPLLDAFVVGGFPLMFPGDPIGPPEELINCRCDLTYSWDSESALTASLWDVEIATWDVTVTEPPVLTAAAQTQTGAMIALAPSVEDAYRLEVGEPAEDLHATLVYLGDDANLTPDQRAAILEWATQAAAAFYPIVLNGFAISAFNPADPEKDTAVVLGLSGGTDGMGSDLMALRDQADGHAREVIGSAGYPAQHEPYAPHVTLAYTDDPEIRTQLDHLTGAPVTFDHLRVAFGGDVYDIPLGQPDMADADGPWDVTVAAGKFEEAKHKRDAKGRFATMASRLAHAIEQGGDNPLSEFSREQLRRHGTQKLGLKFARGESEQSIRDKVAAALAGDKAPSVPEAKPRKAAKKAAPAKAATPEQPEAETVTEGPPTVKPTASTAGRSRGKVEDLQPGDVTRKPLRVTRVIDTGGRYIYIRGMMAGHELEDRYERGQEIDFFRPTPEEIARDKEPREHFAAADDPEIKNNIFAKAAPVNVLEDLHQGRITHEEAATQLRDSAEYLRETADLNEEVGNADNASRMREAAGALDRLADEVGAKGESSKPEAVAKKAAPKPAAKKADKAKASAARASDKPVLPQDVDVTPDGDSRWTVTHGGSQVGVLEDRGGGEGMWFVPSDGDAVQVESGRDPKRVGGLAGAAALNAAGARQKLADAGFAEDPETFTVVPDFGSGTFTVKSHSAFAERGPDFEDRRRSYAAALDQAGFPMQRFGDDYRFDVAKIAGERRRDELKALTPKAYEALLGDGPFGTRGPARGVVEGMQANGWELVASDPMLSSYTFESPDGSKRINYYTDSKKFGAVGGKSLTFKAAKELVGEPETPASNSTSGEVADRLRTQLDQIYERASTDLTVDGRGEAARVIDDLKLTTPQLKQLAKNLNVALPPRVTKDGVRDAIVTRFVGSRLASDALGRPAPGPANPDVVSRTGSVSPRQQAVLDVAATPVTGERRQGGAMGITSLEEHEGGQLIRKDVSNASPGSMVRKPKDQYDAELLAPLIGDAIGLRTAATVEADQPGQVLMEYIPGKTGEELAVFGQDIEGPLDSPDGQLLDLFDAVINNYDRNDGNWIVADDGRIVPIDHSMSFFTGRQLGASAPGRLTVPLTSDELVQVRARIEGLRPEFERLGRGAWLDQALKRFDKLKIKPAAEPSNPDHSLTAAQQHIAHIAATPLEGQSRQGGSMSVTSVEYHEAGQIVRKNVNGDTSRSVRDPAEQVDAEELGSAVADALGLRSAAVMRVAPAEMIMEYIEGTPGAEKDRLGPTDEQRASADGQRIGVMDRIISNPDRNPGNYILATGGRIVPIDHGMAFHIGGVGSRAFAPNFGRSYSLTEADGAEMRANLEKLRPLFERLNRENWFMQMMANFDQIGFGANATKEEPVFGNRPAWMTR